MQNNKLFSCLNTVYKLTRILPFLFWVLLIFGFDTPYLAILTLACAAFHEVAHAFSAFILTGGFSLRAKLGGFAMKPRGTLSYRDEAIIAAAGPLANLLTALTLLPFSQNGYVLDVALVNLFTALSNLLPIKGYDGYRIVTSLADEHGALMIRKIMARVSTAVLFVLTLASLWAVSRLNCGYFATVALVFSLVGGLDGQN